MTAFSVCVLFTLVVFVKGEAFDHHGAICPPGWLKWQESCYTLLPGRMYYTDASTECARRGAAMVVPNSQEENDFIWREMKKLMDETGAASDKLQLWIGCRKTNGRHLTCEGETVYHDYTDWGDGEPSNGKNEDCVRISEDFGGHWGDRICKVLYFAACEMKAALAGHCRLPTRFIHVPQMCLLNHEIKSFQVGGFERCGFACWAEPLCHSFNLFEETDGVMICQLNHANLYEADGNGIGNQENCFFYEK
ncbi:low affinity immunoglobulin epsilon Fc receptor-like [Patiria miniata]|uniref:C-type lectin domain-containing protein n=1 Tax=Patiria miniata TaxID=46514 RepID=A0A913ZPY5_PATMI|nr:low affinity immunoglobulin epsilon Fc receptor-like [Patiria miniata]